MGCETEESDMIEIPTGYVILWEKKNPIPEGWIQESNYMDSINNITGYQNSKTIIAIKKVDNLTWIEHLAKQRGLVI